MTKSNDNATVYFALLFSHVALTMFYFVQHFSIILIVIQVGGREQKDE